MSKRSLVSICLPVFNGERFLRAALDSIISQSYQNVEIIISDDGSTDSSVEIIKQYQKQDKRIDFSQNPKRLGLFSNYNYCLQKASGDFIKLMSQDDLLLPNTVENLVTALESNRNCILASIGKQIIDEKDSVVTSYEPEFQPGVHSGKAASLDCLRNYRNLIGEPVTVLYRKITPKLQFDANYNSLGDLDLCLKLLQKGDFFFVDTLGVSFRSHKDSETTRLLNNLDWVLDFVRLGHQYKELISELGISSDDYLVGATKHLGIFVESLVKSQTVGMDKMDGYKELAFYCLRALGQIEPERIILKDKCDGMKRSMSWRITKPLRAAKAKFSGLYEDIVD